MENCPVENWVELGRWIAQARAEAGYSDTQRWAAKVGRSSRTLLGIERGEPVGAKTLERIAEVLGVANWSLYAALKSGCIEDELSSAEQRRQYERETGLEADSDAGLLRMISDDELLTELRDRLSSRAGSRSERRLHAAPLAQQAARADETDQPMENQSRDWRSPSAGDE